MSGDLVTTREAAELLGVSPSSIKRWADEGLLPCLKTAGSHRRFHRAALEKFRDTQGPLVAGATEVPTEIGQWIDALRAVRPPQALEARLLDLRARLGSWAAAAGFVGDVIHELGRRWQTNELTILDEHLASERLERAIANAGAWLPVGADAPRALLLTAEGDDHTLGLALAELCLRELGFASMWAGRYTPIEELVGLVRFETVRVVAVSASVYSSSPVAMARQADALAAVCAPHGVRLVLGGEGAWPEPPRYGARLHGFDGLADAVH